MDLLKEDISLIFGDTLWYQIQALRLRFNHTVVPHVGNHGDTDDIQEHQWI